MSNENGNSQPIGQMKPNQVQAKFYTTIRIYSGDDGETYGLQLVEPDAKNGNRIDQRIARQIINLDKQLREPQFVNMLQQSRQNPQGFMQGLMQRMFGGGMPMGGGRFPPMGGFMG
ncbi:MAG: hypothetical protein IJW05_15090 [Lentisphaeria bacterium]|nr:hypothetical protein [Lentisphaeria bacterium]MBQ7404754.1 hypothetical protein [Lentisphaeria bacterium]